MPVSGTAALASTATGVVCANRDLHRHHDRAVIADFSCADPGRPDI
jgi:hypothetical protein